MTEYEGTLSRRVPARTRTENFTWIRRPFLTMSQQYRDVRKRMKPMDSCFWCRHKFADGETMNLAGRPKGANVILCDSCADSASSGEEK